MKILAMDTSGQTASAALVDGNKLVGEYTQNDKLTHSQTILPMIAEICRQTNTEPAALDYIACAVGPGSFTGLRIGAATAKGLCLGWDKPLIPVPTLDALAYNVFMTDAVVCPIMDARRNQVYACFYQWHGEILVPLTKYMAESIEIVMEMAQRWKRKVLFLGDGVAVHRERLMQYPDFHFAPAHCALQRAASVAALAQVMAREGKAIPGSKLELIYLRKSQAEREREAKLSQRKEEAGNV